LNTSGIVLHENSEWVECLGIDGIIGSNMLRNSVVQFDEQKKHHIRHLFLLRKASKTENSGFTVRESHAVT
jgi:hypothetical protein